MVMHCRPPQIEGNHRESDTVSGRESCRCRLILRHLSKWKVNMPNRRQVQLACAAGMIWNQQPTLNTGHQLTQSGYHPVIALVNGEIHYFFCSNESRVTLS